MAFLGLTYRGILTSGVNLGFGGITRRRSSYTPEAISYFSAVEAAGGTLTDNVKSEFDAFVVREKDAGRWDKYIALFPFLGGTVDSGVIDAKNLLYADKTGSNLVDADFGDVIGVTGDGTSKRLDTTLIAANIFDSTTDLQIGVFTGKINASGMWIGAGNSTPTTTMLWFNNTNAYYGNYQTIPKDVTDSNDSSFLAFTGGQAFTMENGVAAAKITPVSYNLPTTSFGILTRRFNNSWSSGYVDGTVNGAFFAKGMSEAELTDFDTSYRTFVNNITTYAASQAYFSAVTASGGTLTDNVQAEFTSFVSREVEAGRWSKIKRLYVPIGGAVNAYEINAVDSTKTRTNINFTNTDMDSVIGATGDGSTKTLTEDLTLNNIYSSMYDMQMGMFLLGGTISSGNYFISAVDGGNWVAVRAYGATSPYTLRVYHGASTNTSDIASIANTDVVSLGRYSDSSLYSIKNTTEGTHNTTTITTPIPVKQAGYFSLNGASYFQAVKSGGEYMAAGWSLAEHKEFITSYKTFINNITAYAAAQAYFNAVATAGGTLSNNVISEFTSFVSREVNAGRWSKLKRLYPFLGGKINSAVIDVVTTNAATNSNFVDADADATIGLQGDGSTKYLTDYQVWSNIISSQYKVTIGNFYGSGLNQENSNPYIYGSISGGNYITTRILSTSTIARSYVGLSSPFSQVARTLLSNESVIATRLSNVYSATLVSGSIDLVDTSTTTYSMPANEPSYFKANGAGGISQGLSNGFFIAEFDTLQEVKDFESSYKTFITNVQAYAALMDSYAGAAAAYSLRKLYSSYTGSAINVRRSSDNATQDIGFDGYVLDTASLLSFVGAGSGYVTTWYDQSGNGVDMVQALAASQPTIVNTGSLVVDGGLPTIQFDGVDDILTTNISLLVGDVIDIFGVHNGNDATSLIYHASGTDVRRWFMIGQSGSGSSIVSDYINITNSDVYKNGVNSLTLNTRDNWYTTFFNGAKNLSRILGTISVANWTQFSLNGYPGFQTQIKTTEVILYKSNQSTNRAAIESLINTYYGIY